MPNIIFNILLYLTVSYNIESLSLGKEIGVLRIGFKYLVQKKNNKGNCNFSAVFYTRSEANRKSKHDKFEIIEKCEALR